MFPTRSCCIQLGLACSLLLSACGSDAGHGAHGLDVVEDVPSLSTEWASIGEADLYRLEGVLCSYLEELDRTDPDRYDPLIDYAIVLMSIAEVESIRALEGSDGYPGQADDAYGAERCGGVAPEWNEAQRYLRDAVELNPHGPRAAEILLHLGEIAWNEGRIDNAERFYRLLIEDHPDSPHRIEACLLLGDLCFDDGLRYSCFTEAYDCVLESGDPRDRAHAAYILAFGHLNLHDFESALTRFQQAVLWLDDAEGETAQAFRRQAMQDMLFAYAEIEDGWRLARDYYLNRLGESGTLDMLERLSALYGARGLEDEREELLRNLIETYPTHPRLPRWAEELLVSRWLVGSVEQYDATVAEVLELLDPAGPWVAANASNRESLEAAASLRDHLVNCPVACWDCRAEPGTCDPTPPGRW